MKIDCEYPTLSSGQIAVRTEDRDLVVGAYASLRGSSFGFVSPARNGWVSVFDYRLDLGEEPDETSIQFAGSLAESVRGPALLLRIRFPNWSCRCFSPEGALAAHVEFTQEWSNAPPWCLMRERYHWGSRETFHHLLGAVPVPGPEGDGMTDLEVFCTSLGLVYWRYYYCGLFASATSTAGQTIDAWSQFVHVGGPDPRYGIGGL